MAPKRKIIEEIKPQEINTTWNSFITANLKYGVTNSDTIEDENQFNTTSSTENCLNLSTNTTLIEDPKIKKILSLTDQIIEELTWTQNYQQNYLRNEPTRLHTTAEVFQRLINTSKNHFKEIIKILKEDLNDEKYKTLKEWFNNEITTSFLNLTKKFDDVIKAPTEHSTGSYINKEASDLHKTFYIASNLFSIINSISDEFSNFKFFIENEYNNVSTTTSELNIEYNKDLSQKLEKNNNVWNNIDILLEKQWNSEIMYMTYCVSLYDIWENFDDFKKSIILNLDELKENGICSDKNKDFEEIKDYIIKVLEKIKKFVSENNLIIPFDKCYQSTEYRKNQFMIESIEEGVMLFRNLVNRKFIANIPILKIRSQLSKLYNSYRFAVKKYTEITTPNLFTTLNIEKFKPLYLNPQPASQASEADLLEPAERIVIPAGTPILPQPLLLDYNTQSQSSNLSPFVVPAAFCLTALATFGAAVYYWTRKPKEINNI